VLIRSIAFLVLAGTLFTGCDRASSSVRAAMKPEKDRRLAPDFSLKDATGATVKLSDYRGKVILLNFWATWCGPCQIEIPWLIDFQQTYKDRDFAVLGISMDDDGWDSVKPYLQQKKLNYRVMIGTQLISEQYGGVDSLPTTFVIDREGRIAVIHYGLVSKSEYLNDILNLLNPDGIKKDRIGRDVLRGVPAFLRAR
jgi:peroxiredoxin